MKKIFRHLLPVFKIYTKSSNVVFEDIRKKFISFMSQTITSLKHFVKQLLR